MSNTLQALSEKKPTLVSGNVAVKSVVNIKMARDIYKAKIEKYREKFFNYNNKYS